METVQQNGRFTLFSSKFLSIYSILYVGKPDLTIRLDAYIQYILYDQLKIPVCTALRTVWTQRSAQLTLQLIIQICLYKYLCT